MKTLLVLTFVAIMAVSCVARDMIVGSTVGARLVWQKREKHVGIPFIVRVKDTFYNDPSRIIRSIIARDLDDSEAEPSVTAGGVGSTFANIRLKSARGKEINYEIEIYV